MRKLFTSMLVIFVLLQWASAVQAASLKSAYENHQSNVQVQGCGTALYYLWSL